MDKRIRGITRRGMVDECIKGGEGHKGRDRGIKKGIQCIKDRILCTRDQEARG